MEGVEFELSGDFLNGQQATQKRQEVLERLAARAERKYGNADTEYGGQYPPQMMRWLTFRIVALVLK